MSRLLLQATTYPNASPLGAPPSQSVSQAGMIYTFAFIGATVLVGVCFLGVVFKYVVTYRHWRPPVTTPLQVRRQLCDWSLSACLAWLLHCLPKAPAFHVLLCHHVATLHCISVGASPAKHAPADRVVLSCSLGVTRKSTSQNSRTSRRLW